MPVTRSFSSVIVEQMNQTKRGHGNCHTQLAKLDAAIAALELDLTSAIKANRPDWIKRIKALLSRQYLARQVQFASVKKSWDRMEPKET